MNEILRIRSAKDYFEEYGREALYKQKADKKLVKQQLIDAFHKEIFGLVAMRAKKRFDDIPVEGDPEALRIASNVVKDETKKWKKLCDMLNYYAETSGCIQYSDLTLIPEEGNGEIGFENGELVTRRDILGYEPVEPDPYAAVEYYEQSDEEEIGGSEGDMDGDQLVTDEPDVDSNVAIPTDIPDTHEEHDH